MSDRSTSMNDGDQLFKKMDDQERIYSPETVPGAVNMPAEEVDADSPAGHAVGSGDGIAIPVAASGGAGASAGPNTTQVMPMTVPTARTIENEHLATDDHSVDER